MSVQRGSDCCCLNFDPMKDRIAELEAELRELADKYTSKCDDLRSAENALGQVIDLLKTARAVDRIPGVCLWCGCEPHDQHCLAAPWLKVDTGA